MASASCPRTRASALSWSVFRHGARVTLPSEVSLLLVLPRLHPEISLTRLPFPAQRYLKWLSIPAATFNVGNYRRENAPQPSADFFDTNNAEGERKRRAAADAAVSDMLKWFKSGGVVGILDATNSTKERRKWVLERISAAGIEVIFVESRCDDEELIMANIRDVKTTSPDYLGQDPEKAAVDFRERIGNYEKVYKSINDDGDEDHLTYLKIMNVGKQVFINRIQDYLQSRVVYFLMNLHIRPRSVWLSRVRAILLSPICQGANFYSARRINAQFGGPYRW